MREPAYGLGLAVVVVVLASAPGLEAQTGTVRGQVTAETGQALPNVLVSLSGTARTVRTGGDGRYVMPDLPAGAVTLRVTAIGYATQTRAVDVTAGSTVIANFALQPAAMRLDAIVVTATGDQRALEVPHTVTQVDAERAAEEVAPTNLASVIQGRAPGVQIINASGSAGTGTKIRIRGSSSMSLTNEPIVLVDGVRVDNSPANGPFVGGQVISRINDFNPDEIESIEVVKGPSAAALYGTDAANGVIVIKTKRGRAGPPVFNLYSEIGTSSDVTRFPNNDRGMAADSSTCRVPDVATGFCEQVGLQSSNPLASAITSPLTSGGRSQLGGNVAGGTSDVQYFLSAEYARENGVYTLPVHTRDSILAQRPDGYEIPDFVLNPNQVRRVSLRANLNARLHRNLTAAVSTGYVDGTIHEPWNDNNVRGLLVSGLLGNPDSTVDGGWGFYAPEEVFWLENSENVQRFTQSVTATWMPAAWLDVRAVGGLDYSGSSVVRFQAPGTGPGAQSPGDRVSSKISTWSQTLDVTGNADVRVTDRIAARTSVGLQYFRYRWEFLWTEGQKLPPGAGSNASATDQYIDEAFDEHRTLGIYLQEQVGYDDRLFVTGALRGDDNSAFGKGYNATFYPKAGVSYLVVDHTRGLLDNVRLRTAWGASGVKPFSNAAVLYFTGGTLAEPGGDVAGVRIANAGNTDLKPERSEEWEAGFEAGLLGGRLGVGLTYYNRTTKDALVYRDLAPSLGLTTNRLENIARTRNFGIEAGINGRFTWARWLRWDFSLAGSTNTNEVVELGEGVEPIAFSEGNQVHNEGYPLGAFWDLPFTYEDVDGNGLLTADEVTVGDTAVFLGYARPRYEVALFNAIDIGSWLRISGLFDYRGGHVLYNRTDLYRCRFRVCPEVNDPRTPLSEQARAIAGVLTTPQTTAGYIEPAWFIKLRELSFTFFAPPSMARRLGASRASLTITGRNLLTITDYGGFDPEVQQSAGDFTSLDFMTQPQVRYWTARLQLTF